MSNPPLEPTTPVDVAIVGAGIVGLAHALEAHVRGLSVHVIERDHRAVGASIRNFGHICTTVQSGRALDYATVARERWIALADKIGVKVARTGTLVVARSAAEMATLEQLKEARDRDQVELLGRNGVREILPLIAADVVGGAHLPLDIRLDPRAAIPALAAWLADEGVTFSWGTHAGGISTGVVHTSRGDVPAARIVHASGHDLDRLFPEYADQHHVRRCRLQMLEVAPPGGVTVAPAVLTGTSMLRYGGLAEQPATAQVRADIEASAPELLDASVNLMFTQRPDGAIVLGDSHHYERTHLPFDEESVADLLLRHGAALFGLESVTDLQVLRRWRGVYADSPSTDFLVEAPDPATRLVAVTSGIGMTTALGLAPTVLDDLS